MRMEEALQAVHTLMYEVVQSSVPILQEASRHIIAAGGKRIRPRLLLLSYQACGGADLSQAVPVAAAVELVHTATLVHDDINDRGVMRRGRVTINEKWGHTFALLTGDFLFTKVYELMAPYNELNVTFAETTVALVEGETLQASAAKDDTLNREMYQQIVAKKTASLFRGAAMLGAQLARADSHQVALLGEFGFYLGLAFQIVDDLLDLTGDPRLLGKGVGMDMAQGKGVATAFVSTSHDSYTPEVAQAAPAVVMDEAAASEADSFLAIKRRLIAGGAVDEGRLMVQAIAAQAHATLSKLPPGPGVDALRELITMAIDRDY